MYKSVILQVINLHNYFEQKKVIKNFFNNIFNFFLYQIIFLCLLSITACDSNVVVDFNSIESHLAPEPTKEAVIHLGVNSNYIAEHFGKAFLISHLENNKKLWVYKKKCRNIMYASSIDSVNAIVLAMELCLLEEECENYVVELKFNEEDILIDFNYYTA